MQEDSATNDGEFFEGSEVFVPADEAYEHPEYETNHNTAEPVDRSRTRTPTRGAEQTPMRLQNSNDPSSHYLDPPI